MNYFKIPWLRVALGVVLLAGLAGLSAADKKEKQEKEEAQTREQSKQHRPAKSQQTQSRQSKQPSVQPQQSQSQTQEPQMAQPQQNQGPQSQDRQSQPQQNKGNKPEDRTATREPDVRGQEREPQHRQSQPQESAGPQEGRPEKGRVEEHRSQPQEAKERPSQNRENPDQGHGQAQTVPQGRTQEPPRPKLTEVKNSRGVIERASPSHQVRERTIVDQKTGERKTQQIAPTGRIERQEVQRKDGAKEVIHYDLGREKRVQIAHKDGRTEVVDVHYNRNGEQRSRETIIRDVSGRALSRTVVVKQTFVIRNTTIVNNTTVVRNYNPGRFGFVYRPVVLAPVVFVSWYDPYWYTPARVPIYHPFRYSWGWDDYAWYHHRAYYWQPYPVYPAPCYWVTDWLVAAYIADQYAVATSVAQTREEVRLAREDAEKARIVAERARDAAEIAEAKAAQAAAEARADRAEARVAKAELQEARAKELAGKPNPKAAAIDNATKEALKDQVDKVIAEKKEFADQSAKGGNPVPRDVTVALADPKHIYPVSKNISVTRAEDGKPAGTLTAGDLLKLEPGQDKTLADATENTPITMRVITSKGEDDSVTAGTLIAVPLKDLQEFDNEFRAKIDLGLAEADNNKAAFKNAAVN